MCVCEREKERQDQVREKLCEREKERGRIRLGRNVCV